METTANEVGVYVFNVQVDLGGRPIEIILYVGKTTNLSERLSSYLRIKKGYDDSRPAISEMFAAYRDKIKFLFAPTAPDRLARVERAIYETTLPAFNIIAPPVS